MPEFYTKKHNNLECTVAPDSLIRRGLFKNLPYIGGEPKRLILRVKKLVPEATVRLKDLDFRYKYPDGTNHKFSGHTVLDDKATEWQFETVTLPASGYLELWIGTPSGPNSKLLAKINSLDKQWVWVVGMTTFFSTLFGVLFSDPIKSLFTYVASLLSSSG